MKPRRAKTNKRKNPATKPKSPFSQALRDAREAIARGETEKGLTDLNGLAASTRNPVKRAKILLLIGESETRHSRHTEALAAFTKANLYANQAKDLDLVLLSGTGQVRSLLRSLRTEEAKTAAKALLSDLEAAEKALKATLALTPAQLAAQGAITVPARPPSLTVGLTKVANAFIESGLTDEARLFLRKAIQLSPNGASRARQSLAKLALAADQPELAERYAREALLMGRFQAKTVAAWQLYLDARARQNKAPIMEDDVFAAFRQHGSGRRATTSILSIARVLRAHGDPAWKTIAASALTDVQAEPIVATEIEKLLHADSKLFGTEEPRQIAARSLKLFRAKDASKQELVAHAKEYVRFSLQAGENPDSASLLRIAGKRYPGKATFPVRHAMALGAMMAQRHDLARTWLIDLATAAAQESQTEAWGKATWALARMESLLEKNAEAAFWYMEVAAHPGTPPRFKIQAMLRGLKFLGKSGDNSTDIGKLSDNIRSILAETDDFRILLDAARQLALAGSKFTTLNLEFTQVGIRRAKLAAKQSKSSLGTLEIYEYLSRKLHFDSVGQNDEVVGIWNSHSSKEKCEFAAVGGSLWYEYVRIVFLAMTSLEMIGQAEELVSGIVNGNQATPEGYVIVGSAHAEWLIANGKTAQAFDFFEWIAKEAPTHRRSSSAHYWLALRKFKSREWADSKRSAVATKKCFSGNPSLLTEWEIDARASFLLWIIDILAVTSRYPEIPESAIETHRLILSDLSKI